MAWPSAATKAIGISGKGSAILETIDTPHYPNGHAEAIEAQKKREATMASSLYRHLGQRIGHGYDTAKSRQLFLDFIDATRCSKAGF